MNGTGSHVNPLASKQLNSHANSASARLINDENVLKKLTEMSIQFAGRQSSGSDFSYSIASNSIDEQQQPENQQQHQPISSSSSTLLSSTLKMIEQELGRPDEQPMPALTSDKEITSDLRRFLRFHNIKEDGNLVETRRLDLRANQQTSANTNQRQKRIFSKHNAESLFEQITLGDEPSESLPTSRLFLADKNKNNSIRFSNPNAEAISQSTSSSSESEDDGDSSLWIERYRKQKLAISGSKSWANL